MQTISGSVIKWLQENQRTDFEIHARFTVEMFGGKRWCFMTCALFMLCPRNFLLAGSSSHRRSQYRKEPLTRLLSKPINVVPRWSMNVINDKGTDLRLEEPEPGFDLNAEEIKRLKIWPGGAIPYYIDEFSFDKVFRDRLRSFLDVTNSATGLNFLELPRPPGDEETRWVLFVNRQGLLNCVDHPFKNFTNEGVQKVLLGYDCLSNGGGFAEVVLALVGVPPQHNAPDRDKYIEIMKDNIMPEKAYLFEILKDSEWLFHDVSYDIASAGHYSLHKYTKNGKATIKPLNAVQGTFGEGKGFSYTDIWKIRMMYNYISNKRFKSLSGPQCKKLFNLGANFNKYEREPEDSVQPRKKPNKFLGLPDDPKIPDNEEINNDTHTSNTDKGQSLEDEKGIDKQPIDILDNSDEESNEKPNDKIVDESNENSANNDEKVSKDITDEKSEAQPVNVNDTPHGLKFTKPGYAGK